ncbi:MAG: hemagglutinin repeat-containing protein [Candidatus Symbiodolus clandestinus]
MASEDCSQQQSSQSTSSHSLGEGFDAGIVNVSEGSGNHQGKSDGYHLAQFKAGKKFTFQSGNDTLVQGIVQAPRLQGKIGGNITFKSLQDTDGQQGWQQQLGVSLTVGPESRRPGIPTAGQRQYPPSKEL